MVWCDSVNLLLSDQVVEGTADDPVVSPFSGVENLLEHIIGVDCEMVLQPSQNRTTYSVHIRLALSSARPVFFRGRDSKGPMTTKHPRVAFAHLDADPVTELGHLSNKPRL